MSGDMRAAAVIAEYNPFHNGHALHLRKTRELFGATHIAAIMSGDAVQRGGCACVSKWVRADMALRCGADLVIELPPPWSAAGAERFALGGVALAQALGCVDILSFGSECGDISRITGAAGLLKSEQLSERLRELLSTGMTFAAARAAAAQELCPESKDVLSNPNDTLGVEYCRAIERLGAQMKPVCVKREGAAHDHFDCSQDIASASLLRERMAHGGDVWSFIPNDAKQPLSDALERHSAPALMERLDRAALYRLREMTAADFALLPDISEGLENRIYAAVRDAQSVAQVCAAAKTKRYALSRIRRIVYAAVLGMTAGDCGDTPPYIRILGMNAKGKELLAAGRPSLPIISRAADVRRMDHRAARCFELSMRAADILALATESIAPRGGDAAHGVIVL